MYSANSSVASKPFFLVSRFVKQKWIQTNFSFIFSRYGDWGKTKSKSPKRWRCCTLQPSPRRRFLASFLGVPDVQMPRNQGPPASRMRPLSKVLKRNQFLYGKKEGKPLNLIDRPLSFRFQIRSRSKQQPTWGSNLVLGPLRRHNFEI